MGARRAAACLCTARVLREAVAAGTWRAPECAGGPLWDPGADLWWGPGALEGRAYGGVLDGRMVQLLLRPCVPDYPFRVVRSPSMNASR